MHNRPRRPAEPPRTRLQRGVSILEVMVATVIVSLGIAGVMAANGRGLAGTDAAGYRTQATWLAANLIERARANLNADYTIAMGAATAGAGQAATDLTAWKNQLARALPDGDGSVAISTVPDPDTALPRTRIRVLVRWDDRRASGEGHTLGTAEYRHVVTETYLP